MEKIAVLDSLLLDTTGARSPWLVGKQKHIGVPEIVGGTPGRLWYEASFTGQRRSLQVAL